MKRVLKTGIILMAAFLLPGCTDPASGGDSRRRGKELVVGVRTNLNRFSYYYEDSDSYFGFEDELAEALAERLGYDGVEYVGLEAGEREDALSSGEVDCLIAAFSRTEEREKKFDFSTPYYQDYGRVIAEGSTLFDDWSDLAGRKVGYLQGSNAKEAFLKELVTEGYVSDGQKSEYYCNMVSKNSYEDIMSSLELGTLDAACMDGCIALGSMDEEMIFVSDKYYSAEEYCVATTKDSELSAEIDEEIETMISDGTIAGLEAKWDLIYVTEGGEE